MLLSQDLRQLRVAVGNEVQNQLPRSVDEHTGGGGRQTQRLKPTQRLPFIIFVSYFNVCDKSDGEGFFFYTQFKRDKLAKEIRSFFLQHVQLSLWKLRDKS